MNKKEYSKNTCMKHYLLEECFAMIKHLSSEGKDIPLTAAKILDFSRDSCSELEIDSSSVLNINNELLKRIAPAQPKSIWVLYKESQSRQIFAFLGPVTLIRRMMAVALCSLAAFIFIACSKYINIDNITIDIFNNSGVNLLFILAFYVVSASLGATFSALFQANRFIINNTYDPKYESACWIRFILGVIAGIMLATIIPISNNDTEVAHWAVASRPMLAMLGGFSASQVYRILFRMVYAVESIFIGKQSEITEQKVDALQATAEFKSLMQLHY